MKYFRSFLAVICFGIFGAGSILVNFLLFPFIQNNKELCSDIIRYLWKFFIRLLILLRLIRLDIKRLEKIENKIIAATHPSFIDILILMSLLPRSTCFVKKELASNPILKNIISSIFVPNDIDIEDLEEKSKRILDRGFNLIIFPTGIRHRKDEHLKIKKGAALAALSSGKNIVPVRISTDEDFLFINQPFYAVGEKTVTFEIEMCDEIKIDDFKSESEIVTKKRISQQIEKSLYGL